MRTPPSIHAKFLRPAMFLLALAAALPLMADGLRFPFQGTDLPAPPQQGQPWTPPKTTIPAPVVDAFVKLFQQGLPDPRGCEYREAEVNSGQVFVQGWQAAKIHGWIFADKEGEKFVITLDGIVQPAVSVGAPADLRADVAALLAADKKGWADAKAQAAAQPNAGDWKPSRWNWGWEPFFGQPSQQTMSAEGAALLLRAGENDLASKFWDQWSSVPDGADARLPYFRYAADWMSRLLGEMDGAFVTGDDHLAVAAGHRIVAARKAYDAELAAQGQELGQDKALSYSVPGYFPKLLAEVERRVAEPPHTPLYIDPGTARGAERIKLLIRDLEEVRPSMQVDSDSIITPDDPAIAALVKEGDAAVGPLLDCYEHDDRVIRTLNETNFSGEVVMQPVSDAAYVALAAILKTEFRDRWRERTISREVVAGRIRDYLKKYGALSQTERWYSTLADDNADPVHVAEAMNGITFPARMADNYQGGENAWNPIRPDENPALMGDPLRGKASPSVSDLLLKRLQSVEKQLEGTLDHDAWNKTLGYHQVAARSLAIWDGRNHLDALRKASEICRQNDSSFEFRAWLYEKRAALGDTHALDEYAASLTDIGPDAFDWRGPHAHELGCLFEPAWLHPDSPAIQKAIAGMFSDKGAWSHFWSPERSYLSSLLYSPLAGFAGFRQEVLRGLGDKSGAGTLTVKDGKAEIPFRYTRETYGVDKTDPLLPPPGQPVQDRVCDIYAFYMADLPGAPEFELYWPEAKRDEAVAACVKFLNEFGGHLGFKPGQFPIPPGEVPHAGIRFKPLDHPATEDDVKQHLAIFALDGGRRLVKLPSLPITAVRVSQSAASKQREYHGWPGGPQNVAPGDVVQAEEKLVDGKWERWYGFAGKGGVARVPASDIEFILPAAMNADDPRFGLASHTFPYDPATAPADWTCQHGGIDTQVADPDGTWKYPAVTMAETRSGRPTFHSLPAEKPVLAFSIRNRTGLDMTIPAAFFQDNADPKHLPAGVTLELQCVEITGGKPDSEALADMQKLPWKELPLRGGAAKPGDPNAAAAAPVVLAAAESRKVFQIDLRDFFDLPRRAFFRLKVGCDIPGARVKTSDESWFLIGDPPWVGEPAPPEGGAAAHP